MVLSRRMVRYGLVQLKPPQGALGLCHSHSLVPWALSLKLRHLALGDSPSLFRTSRLARLAARGAEEKKNETGVYLADGQ
jgi:hypothetical protein